MPSAALEPGGEAAVRAQVTRGRRAGGSGDDADEGDRGERQDSGQAKIEARIRDSALAAQAEESEVDVTQ